jgi:hypothetical protein
VVGHAEAIREHRAVARMAVEQLDNTGNGAGGANAPVDASVGNRIDQPDGGVSQQRVRAALQPFVLDPAEPVAELVYDSHLAAHSS